MSNGSRIKLTNDAVSAVILGIMQDAGLPHAGCRCSRCSDAFANPSLAEYAACLAIVDRRCQPPVVWFIDATPDIKYQLNLMAHDLGPHPTRPGRLRQPDGLFLTHAHMGHTAGLAQLGPEGMNVQRLPVFASGPLIKVLKQTRLWQPVIGNLDLIVVEPDKPVALANNLTITPLPVPHRDELGTGTFAYRVQGPTSSLLYLPDIDDWEIWPEALANLSAVDVALVDASFFSRDELGGRERVAHPLVPMTLRLFAELPTQLWLTHFNHTNPILDATSKAEKMAISAGGHIAHTGQTFGL